MIDTENQQNRETNEKWEPIAGIETPAAAAVVVEDHDGLKVTLLFSKITAGGDSDLRIDFGRVAAYSSYEELLHPWETSDNGPRLAARWEHYVYPLLRVRNSQWIASLPNLSVSHPECVHYRLMTLDQIIDILCSKAPIVNWVPVPNEQ
jgi:hypothetical protein